MQKTRDRRVVDVLETCEVCDYDRGFQVSLLRRRADAGTVQGKDKLRVVMICPECGTRYDVGWSIEVES